LTQPIDVDPASRHFAGFDHYERQPRISVRRMAVVTVEHGLPFPAFKPEATGDLSIVFAGSFQ